MSDAMSQAHRDARDEHEGTMVRLQEVRDLVDRMIRHGKTPNETFMVAGSMPELVRRVLKLNSDLGTIKDRKEATNLALGYERGGNPF